MQKKYNNEFQDFLTEWVDEVDAQTQKERTRIKKALKKEEFNY